jgi:hypothetical protein
MTRMLHFLKAMAANAVKGIEGDTSLARVAIETHYKEIFIKQNNREAVAEKALENLKHLSSGEAKADTGPPVIDDDWMNFFASYAEKASSETLRELWGRILSGEIVRPGTFSFTTMRILSELDAPTARLFEEIASKALDEGCTCETRRSQRREIDQHAPPSGRRLDRRSVNFPWCHPKNG